jgi:hypothetical protein
VGARIARKRLDGVEGLAHGAVAHGVDVEVEALRSQ